jgi:general secretion pathway protein G
MRPSTPRRRRGGFTLIEVLLVLVILVVLSSIAVMAYGPAQKRANINTAKTQMNLLKGSLERYKMENYEYPQSLEFLWNDVTGMGKDWGGPYSEPVGADPWGNAYVYESDGTNYQLSSKGPGAGEEIQGPGSVNR